jgi:pilus assembly protein Flp/PilA
LYKGFSRLQMPGEEKNLQKNQTYGGLSESDGRSMLVEMDYFVQERTRSVMTSMRTWMNGVAGTEAARLWSRLLADESGQDLIEYALVMVFIAFGSVATMMGLATNLGTFFAGLGATLTSAV